LSSVIVGAAISAVFFKERFGVPRIAAAGLLVVGIGLMLHAGQPAPLSGAAPARDT
jgi:drug/metabolite transporter (DMT)-like permease